MNSAWPIVRIGDVMALQRRWLRPDPNTQYIEIGVRSFGKGIFHKQPVSGLSLGDKRVLRIEPNDLVCMNIFAWEGAVAVAGESERGTIGSHRFVTLTARDGRADPQFLQRYFQTEQGRSLLLRVSPGSAGRNRTMSIEGLLSQSIQLPPIAEQRRIVARLDALAAKLDKAKGLREEAARGSSALYPAVVSATVDSMECEYRIVRDVLVANAELTNGLSVKSAPDDAGIHCLTLAAVRGGQINLRERKPVPLTADRAKPYLVHRSDVFVVRGNGNKRLCGQAGMVREQCANIIFPDLFIRVPLDNTVILSEFFVAIWNAGPVRAIVEEKAKTTSGIWKVNQGHIESTRVPVPPLAEQDWIVEKLNAARYCVDSIREHQTQTSAELQAMLPSLLNRAFAGAM